MSARLLTIAVLGLASGSAAAQGYQVRTWGYFDRYPYPPTVGETWSYPYGRPMVTVQDPWGGLVDMPLRPKVLYYDNPFLTPQGWHRPTSIAVMPDPRPRTYVVPSRVIESVPVAPAPAPAPSVSAAPPTFRYDDGPASPVPDVDADPPVPKPIPPRPAPTPRPEPPTVPVVPPRADPVPKVDRPAAPAVPRVEPAPKADLPLVPELPKLPDVPQVPGAALPAPATNKVPKLGPTPMDVPPGHRPG